MASFNRVILLGNLVRAPEMRHTATGLAVTKFRLAVSETYRSRQDNQTREVVCYVDVAVWDRQAETCNQYLIKGSPVLIEGRLVFDEWKNQQGETRNRLSVRADRVQFLSGAGGGARQAETADGAAPAAKPPPAAAPTASPQAEAAHPDGDHEHQGGDDEDLPF